MEISSSHQYVRSNIFRSVTVFEKTRIKRAIVILNNSFVTVLPSDIFLSLFFFSKPTLPRKSHWNVKRKGNKKKTNFVTNLRTIYLYLYHIHWESVCVSAGLCTNVCVWWSILEPTSFMHNIIPLISQISNLPWTELMLLVHKISTIKLLPAVGQRWALPQLNRWQKKTFFKSHTQQMTKKNIL